jgi:hypothetical protein
MGLKFSASVQNKYIDSALIQAAIQLLSVCINQMYAELSSDFLTDCYQPTKDCNHE